MEIKIDFSIDIAVWYNISIWVKFE